MRYKKLLALIVTVMFMLPVSAGRVYAAENLTEKVNTVGQENYDGAQQKSADTQTRYSLLYEVQTGDCLWKIAKELLGDGALYTNLVTWNGDLIKDPSLIYPGMKLQIMADTSMGTDENSELSEQTSDRNSGEVSGDSFAQGVVNGTSWESEWLGMRLELPESFEFDDMEEFFDESDTVIEENDSEESTDWEFVATSTSPFGSVIFLAVQQWDGSSDEFIEELKAETEEEVLEDFEVVMSWSEEGTTMIGGRSFEHYYSEEKYMGFPIYQHYYVTKVDDRIVLFFIMYVGDMEKEIDALLGGFSETN